VGGFIIPFLGEDIEYSIRIIRAGFKTGLIEDAYVFHKRRTDFEQFYKQLHFFGRARINIFTFYAEELKPVHFFPALFTLYVLATALMAVIYMPLFMVMYTVLLVYLIAIFIDATVQNKSIVIGSLAVGASLIQLCAYGIGFMSEFLKRIILKRPHDPHARK
jgi:GT2 family glycosyltransferase